MRRHILRRPGQLALVDILPPQLQPGWVRVASATSASAAPTTTSSRATIPSSNIRASWATNSRHRRRCQWRRGRLPALLVVINPYLPCDQCPACLEGKTNCCETLKVHRRPYRRWHGRRDRPAGDQPLSRRPVFRCVTRPWSSSSPSAPMPCAAPRSSSGQRAAGGRLRAPSGSASAYFAKIAGADVTVVDARP